MKYNRIGLYFGSFNPIHKGHLWVVNTALKTCIDNLYLVVSPQSPFKPLSELAPFKDRLEMARLALRESGLNVKAEAVDWEEHMYPSYTAETLQKAIPALRENEVVIFMGLDNFLSIEKWREPKYILEHYSIYILPRGENSIVDVIKAKSKELHDTITPHLKGIFYSNPFNLDSTAATDIRGIISRNEDTLNLLPNRVRIYIDVNGLYKNK